MRVAITVWGRRISPVYDVARSLLVVQFRDKQLVDRLYLRVQPGRCRETVRLLQEGGIGVLICGAISEQPALHLQAGGIHLISFVAGKVDDVLSRYAKGESLAGCRMPGCHERLFGVAGKCPDPPGVIMGYQPGRRRTRTRR